MRRAIKIPLVNKWFRIYKNPNFCIKHEWEIVEYCIYDRYYLFFFMIEVNDWSENA